MLWVHFCVLHPHLLMIFDHYVMVSFHAELLELQQRFEEDKKRVARLKAARKFRPF